MRYVVFALVIVIICATPIVAQYVQATKYQYTTPKVQYYPTSACVMVDADQSSFTCYRDAVSLCKRANSGYCFRNCAQHVRNICFNAMRIPQIPSLEDWEKQFSNRRDCQRAAVSMCRTSTTATQYQDCTRRAYTRCSYIGRTFV